MGRALAIVGFRLRSRIREPGNLAVAILGLAALLLAVLLPSAGGSGDAASAATNALLVVGILAGLEAAAGGGALPADRADGRGEWLSTLAPPPAMHRAGTLLAGLAIPIVAGVAASAVIAGVLFVAGRTVPTRSVVPLSVAVGATPDDSAKGAAASRYESHVNLPPEPVRDAPALEFDVSPVYRDLSAASEGEVQVSIFFQWALGVDAAEKTIMRVPVRGSFSLPAYAGLERLFLTSDDPRIDVRITGARIRGAETSFPLNLLMAGLLLGLAAACVAPVAVLASRATSAPTAALLAGVVMLLGIAKAPMLSLAGDLAGVGGGVLAARILRGAAWVSPDLSAVSSLSDVAAGRALTLSTFAALGPAAAYAALVAAVAVFVPQRKGGR